ncbi:MAG: MobF family relaxase [Verrucomicrobiota bacterium]
MLRVNAHKSAAAAKQYYTEGLSREDYYSENQEIIGNWYGRAAQELKLEGRVRSKEFAAMAENRHPGTGIQLTPRMRSDRIVGYDFNFHSPKSVSVIYALTGDKKIVEAFRAAMKETMTDIESSAETRIRAGGANENRLTGNLAWAEFVHFTSRPIGGIPDPHLHGHNFVFNITLDPVEGKWKAAKFRNLKREAPYFQSLFHARFANLLREQGYEINRTRNGWEIAGLPRTLIDKFSRRTAEIEAIAAKRGITSPEAKDKIGALSRDGKRKGLTHDEILQAWSVRMTHEDNLSIQKVLEGKGRNTEPKLTAAEAVDYALQRSFAHYSVNRTNRVLAEAFRYGVGQASAEAIAEEFGRRGLISKEVAGQELCTTREVILEEQEMLEFARTGKNLFKPLAPEHKIQRDFLSGEQRQAVLHVLESSDQVIGVRGGAGVGKTTLMKEVVEAIEAGGRQVHVFAPSAAASRETLREEGFNEADTVAKLLSDEKLQQQVQGQVIWIDEAGMLGARDMHRIFTVAGADTRIILTGDYRQHSPVARGDAFRILQRFANISMAEVSGAIRQSSPTYRKAVETLSKGELKSAFLKLDELGAIIEIRDADERYERIGREYVQGIRGNSYPLVVSPTHKESMQVTEAIRGELREQGRIKNERDFLRYENRRWTEAERVLAENYRPGLLVQYHQNGKGGIRKGDRFQVLEVAENGIVKLIAENGKVRDLEFKEAVRFEVFEKRMMRLGVGDRIRITRNGHSLDGRRISNGAQYSVSKFNRDGTITLNTGAVLSQDHGHLDHGYCLTSYSSQSKSVREVIVAQSKQSFVAGSQEQFYVSVSRGKEKLRIFTDDREELKESVGVTSTRMAAIEFVVKEMGAEKWSEYVRGRSTPSPDHSHSTKIGIRRKTDSVANGRISWRQYVADRRAVSEPAGRYRAPSLPPQPGDRQRGITQPKRNGLRKSVAERVGVPREKWEKDQRAFEQARFRETVRARRTPRARIEAIKRLTKSWMKRVQTTVRDRAAEGISKTGSLSNRLGKRGAEKTQLQKNHTARVKRQAKQADSGKVESKQVKKTPTPTRKK